jgi:hypothetical protein
MDQTRSAAYSGRPYTLNLRVYTLQQSDDASRYHHDAYGRSNSGYGSFANSASTCNVWVGADSWAHGVPSMPFYPGDYAGKTIGYGSGDGNWMFHDGNGNLNFNVRAQHVAPGPFNTADTGNQTLSADRIGKVPGQVGGVGASSIGTGSATISWSAPSRGHCDIYDYDLHVCDNTAFNGAGCPHYNYIGSAALSKSVTGLSPNILYYVRVRARNCDGDGAWSGTYSFASLATSPTPSGGSATPSAITWTWAAPAGNQAILEYQVRYSTSSTFASGVVTESSGTSRSLVADPLNPATTYYAQVRARNATGWGPWSSTGSRTTLPATAPGISVTPRISGTAADIALTPPSGASGVTGYTVQRKRPDGVVVQADAETNSIVWSGLTPGETNEFRASAWFGTYQSPWSSWVVVAQPNPNTNPGDYFDGATAARDDATFSWTGTANNSTSLATGVTPAGWVIDTAGGGGGTFVRQRITGGRSGTYGCRLLCLTDTSGPSAGVGMQASGGAHSAVVEEGATYVGSMYVRPSRAQRLRVDIAWQTAAGADVPGVVAGTSVLVTDTEGWTRLTVTGVAPAGAERATVKVYDTSGTGHSPWLSGEWLDADDVMVSLSVLFPWFSGDTADAPGYDYQWLGAANASASARLEVEVIASDPLADPDCPPQPTPPALPTIPSDCIEEVGTWRRYPLAVPATEVRIWSATLPTLILETQSNAERQVRIRYYPNPDNLAPELVAESTPYEAEQILTYIPPSTAITLDGVTQQVTAIVAGGASIPADHLLYGTGGTPATWPELRCGIGYVITMDVPLDAPAGNLGARVIVAERM